MEANKETYSFLQFSPVFIPFYCNPLMCLNIQTENYAVYAEPEKFQFQNCLIPNRIIESQEKISHFITKPVPLTSENKRQNDQFSLIPSQFSFHNKISSTLDIKKTQASYAQVVSQNKQIKQKNNDLNKNQANFSQIGKSNWTTQQQQKLKQLVNLFGKRWKYISQHFPSRTGKQIRERYLNYLRPNLSLKRWTEEEDNQIMILVNKYGRSWRTIEKKLKNRSQNQIKNRYYGHLQKSQKSPKCQKNLPIQLQNKKSELRTETSIRNYEQSVQQIHV